MKLAHGLATDAFVLGATDVLIQRANEVVTVAANQDWLELGRFRDVPAKDLFKSLRPFTELGVNCHRHEVVVGAFCRSILIMDRNGATLVQGDKADFDGIQLPDFDGPSQPRLVAFLLGGVGDTSERVEISSST